MKGKANVVIIGGGITGCALAYYLAKRGLKDVILVERKFLASGASGRNTGGIRQQFGTEPNIRLAMESVKIYENLEKELNTDIEYKQGGYLMVAESKEEIKQLEENLKLQHDLGLNSKILSAEEANEIVPELNTETIYGATWCPTDGYANPFKVVEAYSESAKKMGVEINTFTEVTDIRLKKGAIFSVITDKGNIETGILVNAAGCWSNEIAAMVGVVTPNKPRRVEAWATEPVAHILDPLILSLSLGGAFHQAKDGEIVCAGLNAPWEPFGYNINSSPEFLYRSTKKFVDFVPKFGYLNIVRQWAGCYDVVPDAHPIIGKTPGVKGFFQANGYSGHGFMIAPKVAELLAKLIVDEKVPNYIERFDLQRFEGEGEVEEETFVF